MNATTPTPAPAPPVMDLNLVAQRILKLAELSVLEHLEALYRSQAGPLSEAFQGDASEVAHGE